MVFQQPGTALDPVFTLGKQITMVARRHLEGNLKTATRQMLASLASVGFQQPEKIADAYPHQLSGGMRQLAMIAMATVCKPVVLIADEPTTALDNTTQSLILQQFSRLQAEHNTAILLVSHDMSVVKKLSDKILVMYCGRVLESASEEQLFRHAQHPYSAGLLSCIPRISHQRATSINTIPGQVPAASNLPPGCHFSPRCHRSGLQCEQAVPELENEDGQAVACFRPLK